MKGIITILAVCFTASVAHAFQCNECHSKNPAMVRMHQALRGRGCFDCHKIGEKLMGKGPSKDKDSLLRRRLSDPLCIDCHRQTENTPGSK